MREARAVNKRRQLLEEVKALIEEGEEREEGIAVETASLRTGDGSRKWVWGASRWWGPTTPRVRKDVF